jgi:glycolate oxidase
VTIDGEIIEFGGEAPRRAGLRPDGAAVGSEGLLGVVTEVTVKLLPKPQLARVVMACFDSRRESRAGRGCDHRAPASSRPGWR